MNSKKIKFLNLHTFGKWILNSQTKLIDIRGSFSFKESGSLSMKGIKFGTVTGDFDCSFNNLKTLKGCPIKVGGNFLCSGNPIKDLEGSPIEIGGHFEFIGGSLNSLKGIPKKVRDGFCFNDFYISGSDYPILLRALKRIE